MLGFLPRQLRHTSIAFFAVFLVSQTAAAGSWDVTYEYLSQVRKGPNRTNQMPVNQYVGLEFSELPRNFTFDTNIRIYVDPRMDWRRFDLLQAAFHVEPVEHFEIDGGRMWQTDGFDAELMDGGRFTFSPAGYPVNFALYAGVPRYLEDGNFHEVTEGLIAGLAINLQDIKDSTGQFSVRWRKIDASRSNFVENDTFYFGLSGSHQFMDTKTTPNIYGVFGFDAAGKTVDVGTLGVNMYPHWRAALTLEASRFDINRRSWEQTIFGTFMSGSITQAREALQFKIMKNLHFIQDFAWQYSKVGGYGWNNSYIAGAGLDHYWEMAKLSTLAEYYYRRSFGGNVHGGHVNLRNEYFGKMFIDVGADVSRYSKITAQRATAVNVEGDIGYAFTKRCRVSLGGEFNHNNWFDREGRVTMNLELGFNKSDYTPEKRSRRVNRRFHEI